MTRQTIHLRKPGTGSTYCGKITRIVPHTPQVRFIEVDQFGGEPFNPGCNDCWHRFNLPAIPPHLFAGRKYRK